MGPSWHPTVYLSHVLCGIYEKYVFIRIWNSIRNRIWADWYSRICVLEIVIGYTLDLRGHLCESLKSADFQLLECASEWLQAISTIDVRINWSLLIRISCHSIIQFPCTNLAEQQTHHLLYLLELWSLVDLWVFDSLHTLVCFCFCLRQGTASACLTC